MFTFTMEFTILDKHKDQLDALCAATEKEPEQVIATAIAYYHAIHTAQAQGLTMAFENRIGQKKAWIR